MLFVRDSDQPVCRHPSPTIVRERLVTGNRILVYRLGSLGDTIVALPAFHLIAEAFPHAERWVLTNFAVDARAAPLAQVLTGTDLVHGYIRYPIGMRDPRAFLRLRSEIRRFQPDRLVYLTEPRGRLKTLRDIAFFQWCGIHRFAGVPYGSTVPTAVRLEEGTVDYEGARLVRLLHELGSIDLDSEHAFDLRLTNTEREAAHSVLRPLSRQTSILAVSIGAKVDVKDWGDDKWARLLHRLSDRLPTWSLIMLGAALERERSTRLLASWSGPTLNLCGDTTVRESAAVLKHARLFIGHDSGPMHLAAAVGTTCVAVFSSRSLPRKWFPYGAAHRVLYADVPCRGCNLDVCTQYAKRCIASITVDDVFAQVESVLQLQPPGATPSVPLDSTGMEAP